MAAFLDRVAGAARPLLWLDDEAYTSRVLAGGAPPWLDVARTMALRRKAADLLASDVAAVPVAAIAWAWVVANAGLREVMGAKQRAVAPARALLADEGLQGHLVEIVAGLRAALPKPTIALAMPSPRAWVFEAHGLAFGPGLEVEVGPDEVDSCAVYVAAFLRAFGEAGVEAVLLEEREGDEPTSADELRWYQPVFNVAAQYRWDVGIRLPTAVGFSGEVSGPGFVVAPTPVPGAVHGLALGDEFWGGAPAPPAEPGAFRFATVPVGAVPENVLARLTSLRG